VLSLDQKASVAFVVFAVCLLLVVIVLAIACIITRSKARVVPITIVDKDPEVAQAWTALPAPADPHPDAIFACTASDGLDGTCQGLITNDEQSSYISMSPMEIGSTRKVRPRPTILRSLGIVYG